MAEQGSYRDLSRRKEGAFTKLMEWQMSGAETGNMSTHSEAGRDMAVRGEGGRGPPTEKEEIQLALDEGSGEQEGESESESEGEEEEATVAGSKAQEAVEKAVQTGRKN